MSDSNNNKITVSENELSVQKHSDTGVDGTVFHNVSNEAVGYLNRSVSDNTIRARKTDLKVFTDWGGHLPSTPEEVANFLADQASNHGKAYATLARYISSLNHWHGAKRIISPCKSELVRAVRSGIARTHGKKQKRAKPLLTDMIKQILDAIEGDHLADVRNRSMVSLGFSGAFRRSELVALTVDDLEFVDEGVNITLKKSKANQEGEKEVKAIPYAHRAPQYCPVKHLQYWLEAAEITSGPVFPRVTRSQRLGKHPMTGDGFAKLLKKLLAQAGLDIKDYSAHSLRSGLITSAHRAGKDRFKTKQISGHKDDNTFDIYIHETDPYVDSPADLF